MRERVCVHALVELAGQLDQKFGRAVTVDDWMMMVVYF